MEISVLSLGASRLQMILCHFQHAHTHKYFILSPLALFSAINLEVSPVLGALSQRSQEVWECLALMRRALCWKPSTHCSGGRNSSVLPSLSSETSQGWLRKTCSDTICQEQTNENCDTLYSVLVSGTAKTLLFIHQKTAGCISILLLGNVIVKCLESLSWWKAGDKWKTSCPFLSNNWRFRVWERFLLNSTSPVWEDFWKSALIENFVRQLFIGTRSFKKNSKCT